MNRIKHFMILALALAMSLGAWAQQEVLLTTVTATGETSYSQSPDGIVTVTLNIGFYDDYDYGWLGGTVTVEANQGYTITRCVFKQNTVSIADDLAPFTATLSGYSTDNVSVETSNGHVNGDADHMIGITSIEVYGYAADPSPTVTHNADGSWSFTMPGYDAALNVTYYLQPDLAWTYNSAAMPAEGLTAYRGFVLPVIGGIGASMDHDFLTALQGGTVSLRYGSVNGVVTFTDPNDRQSFTVTGSGLDTVYMVFDGNDDYQYDSVSFPVKIADPDTLTLSANGQGTVSALLGGGATWTTETWANLPSDQNLSPLTFGDITISTTGSLAKYSSYNPGKLSFFVRKHDNAETLTFSSEGGNFSRIEMTMVSEYSQYNPDIIPLDGWTIAGHTAVWEGDAPSVTVTSCSTYVSQITFTRGIDSIVVLDEAAGTYAVIPGATVQVVAEAQDGNYVQGWNEIDKAVTNRVSDTATIVVNQSQTLTATFAQNPLLTLAKEGNGTVELDGVTYDTVYTITFNHHDSPSGSRAITIPASRFPYDTIFNYGSAEVMDPYASEPSGKLSIIAQGEHTVTLRISGAFEGNGNYGCRVDGFDIWSISCTAVPGNPIMPEGVTNAGNNTYRVLPGTEVTVVAAPDTAYYFKNWTGEADAISNEAVVKTLTMGETAVELTANFQAKPTLTLTQTEGGTLEAIVPEGEPVLLTTIIPSSNALITNSQTNDTVTVTLYGDLMWGEGGWIVQYGDGFHGAVSVTAAAGFDIAYYKFYFSYGDSYIDSVAPYAVYPYFASQYSGQYIYSQINGQGEYIGRGAVTRIEVYTTSAPNVIASSTPNTYIIDYGTPVTVVATPDAQHYLKNFEGFADTNSNVAVEKTYDSVIAPIDLTANFQAKPMLTLTANDGGTLTLDGMTEPSAEGTTFTVPGTWQDDNTPLTATDFPGFVPVSQEQALNWQAPASGNYRLFYKYEGGHWYYINFNNGTLGISNYEDLYHFNIYNIQNIGRTIAYTTGAIGGMPAGVVSANATRDTFVVDYNTELTVTATPDSIHYLATLGGVTMGSNTAKDTTFAVTATTNLAATFTQKPTLTLAHNDGGTLTLDGMPQGGGEETLLTTVTATSQTTSSQSPDGIVTVTLNNIESYYADNGWVFTGSVTVEAAQGYTITRCVFKQGSNQELADDQAPFTATMGFDGDDYYVSAATSTGEVTVDDYGISSIEVYGYQNVAPNVIASSTPNTYYVDYNTSVTVKATPSDTTYLVRFDQDADINSNVAVEKTYGPLTANDTARATFAAKPVLTLAQNEADWGKVTLGGYSPASLSTAQLSVPGSWAEDFNHVSPTDMPTDFQAVDENVARAWQNTTGKEVYLIFAEDDGEVVCYNFYEDGSYDESSFKPYRASIYELVGDGGLALYTTGAIGGMPAGVAQIDSVTYRVDYGTTLTVQADATELHHVKNWVDADSVAYPADSITFANYFVTTPEPLFPAHSTLSLTVTADTVTKAIFGINSYDVFARVDTTEDVRGTVRAEYIDIDGVSQSVAADDTVTYTAQGGSLSLVIATPTEPGYHFERWTDTLGAELGTNDTLEVTEAAAVIAVFDTNVYQISGTVAEGSEEWGEVTGSGDYRHFTQATLEALPIEHYHFVKWEDGNTENPRVIDVVGPESHQAEFAIDRFIVSWSSNDEAMGHVVGPYDNHTTGAPIPRLRGSWGTTFQLVAQPAEHHMLDYWSSGQTTDIIQHTITENAELVAYFKHVPYIVTVLSEDETMGTVAGTDTLEWQESTEISATANYGYHFTMWNDSVTDNPRTVVNNIESDQTFTASFAKNEYTVTVVSADETMGSVSGTDTVEYLDEIEISATANEHYHFVQWNDGETANPRTVSVTKNETYTATFAPNVYTLTLGSNNAIMGTVALTAPAVTPNADGSYSIAYGTAVTVQGSASSRCFELGSWSDGAVVTADGSHSFSMAGDLVLTATFVNHLFRSDTVADVCDRFVWHGIAYTETPDVAPLHRLTTVDGCDSALVLNLTVRHSSTGVDEQVHCTPYTWIDGVTYSESNHTAQYILPGANAEQCDSIVTLDLTIGTQAESTEVVNACDSYEWHGVVYTETPAEAPTYTYHTLEGCDSTVTLQLTIGHPTEGIETIVACAPIEWHGTVYSESTDEPTWHTTNAAGCDSTVTLHLTIAPAIETEETVEACDEYEWHGVVYTETPAEAPTYTTVSVQGCDSTVTLHLTVNHSTAAVETVVACNSYEWHGVSYASSTTVPTYTTTGSNGCDSTTTLHLTINHSASAVETVEACDSYEWHGTTYTASTSLPTYTTEGSNGCDSTTTLNLTIKQSSRATETVVTCDEYEWHGVLFTETPVEAPTYTTDGSNGCDSTVTLNLTVNHSADVVETIGACAAIEWHGTVYSESTTEPTWHSTTVAGCDSTVTLHLTISDRIETEETVVACDSYEWHGVVYTASTDNATWSATSIQGCDSTVTLHLTINRSTTGSETIEACESYEWHGVTYRQSGSYTFDTLNVAGCDSTVTLTLTLHQPTSGSEFVTTCGSYVWHEVTYTQSGAYVWHGTDVHGCDSTVTLLLTILQPVYSTENRTACNSYTWHGTEYSESGDYTWSTTAVSGCDSIVTLHLTINLPVTSDVEESACERYTWNGIVYSTSGDYVQTFTGVNGCDSTVTLHLTVNMPATETLGVTACDSYEWHEVTYTESGVYSWHGTTVAGCDSTATLNLTIGHSADTTISLQGEGSIVWNGETFTQSGTYERVIRTVLGCDSTVTLNLVILPEGFVMPYLYNIMDVVLTINHFQQGETNLQYHWYRWYRNGKMVAEGRAMDTYSEGGSKLNGVYYLEVAIDESLEYWVRSNEVTIGTVGIDEAEDIDFTVAPNPVMHGSTVSVAVEGADVQGAVISVYDVQGREVLRQQNSAFIEAPAASGMYMVRLTLNDGRTAVKRLIVR